MKLTVLGSGSSYPFFKRRPTAFGLEIEKRPFLIDCGETCLRSAVQYGIDWRNIEGVFITHYHTDHVAGLMPMLLTLFIYAKDRKPFTLWGPPGLSNYINVQKSAPHCDWMDELPFPLEICELNEEEAINISGNSRIEPIRVEHKKISFGYRVTNKEKVIAFSGDTILCDGLFRLADGAEIFVCESGKPDESENPVHISYSQIGQVAKKANVKHLVINHFDNKFESEKLTSAIRKNYDGKLTLSIDGMTFSI